MLIHKPTTNRRKVAKLLLGLTLLTSQAEADWTVAMQRDPSPARSAACSAVRRKSSRTATTPRQ
ncbi:MAG: hypothetical protein H6972_03170 [Gammaproteobacteria bacterium]|nr:hypothetical protein [Gammaproteobacteria bacterium]